MSGKLFLFIDRKFEAIRIHMSRSIPHAPCDMARSEEIRLIICATTKLPEIDNSDN